MTSDMDQARREVCEFLDTEEWIARAALDEEGGLEGWIGAIPRYDGHAWEMHPLVIRLGRRRRGLGTALVADLVLLPALLKLAYRNKRA